MPEIYEHAKNIPEVDERRRTFSLDTVQNHRNHFFSANFRQCNIACNVVHVQCNDCTSPSFSEGSGLAPPS